MFWLWPAMDVVTRAFTWNVTGREKRYNPFWPFG